VQSIGFVVGGYNADFNTDSILKGFQLQGQRQQAGLAQQARLQAKVDKDKQNLQNQVLKYSDFSKLHPLLQPQAKEQWTAAMDNVMKSMESGDVDNYVQTTKQLSDLKQGMMELEGKSQLITKIEQNEKNLSPQARKIMATAYENRDIRSAEGVADKWGNSIVGGVPKLRLQPNVNPEQELLKAFQGNQTVVQTEVPYYQNGAKLNRLQTISGVPPTKADAMRLGATADVVTADEIANALWQGNPQIREAVMLSNADKLEQMFPDKQGDLSQDPEVQEAARKMYEQSAIDQARVAYKSQGLAQEANKFESGAKGGGFNIGKNTFNFGKVEAADTMPTLAKIGDISGWNNKMTPEEIKALIPSGRQKEIITIDPPNAAQANMTINGKNLSVENFKYIYSEKQGKWFVVGTTKEKEKNGPKFIEKPVVAEINDATYGGIFGVYKDAPLDAINNLFNSRLKAAGYEQNFALKPNVPKQNVAPKKSTTKKSGGSKKTIKGF